MKIPRLLPALPIVAGLLLLGRIGLAADQDVGALVAALFKARNDRALGIVTARVYAEPSRPGAGPAPQASVLIHLVPYSAAFEANLDAVRTGLRDSLGGYTRAVSLVEESRVDFERALVAAGGGALVRSEVTDADGAVRLADIPAGDWLMLAWRESGHLTKRFKRSEQDLKRYPDVPTTTTYSMVTYWRVRVTVSRGETAEVAMNDRNVWMTAPREESGASGRPRAPATGAPKRR